MFVGKPSVSRWADIGQAFSLPPEHIMPDFLSSKGAPMVLGPILSSLFAACFRDGTTLYVQGEGPTTLDGVGRVAPR